MPDFLKDLTASMKVVDRSVSPPGRHVSCRDGTREARMGDVLLKKKRELSRRRLRKALFALRRTKPTPPGDVVL